ncbi:MAG: hypothetical protein IJO33_05665 [Bacilli bacterium]|nr:hypothetical protein [Bacilli bacterium]
MTNQKYKMKSYLIKTREFIKKTLEETAIVTQSNISLITSGNIPSEFSHVVFFFNVLYLYYYVYHKFFTYQYLKESTEYNKLKPLYDDYLNEIVNLMHSFGKLDIYEISILYSILLHRGIFSNENKFKYHKYINDEINLRDVSGARIASGTAVCRHMSANLIDIYQKLGYNAFEIGCCTDIRYKFIKKIIATHSIAGISDNKNMLIVDPTGNFIGFFNSKPHNTITMIPINTHKSQEKEFYVPKSEAILNNAEHKKLAKTYEISNYIEENGIEKMTKSFDKIYALIEQNASVIQEWKEKNKVLIQEISRLEKELTNYSDQPTRKLNR